ncbi:MULTISPECIES: nitroreductase family protein [Clostridium]|jgi:nitroreductase|uniref:Nitroreductase family protein n=2 Tax=Clostridium beijerinckii TaxID=1520 RepID=A0AAW3WB14_CLOBE|nr:MULTISPECIES: nitroreductase family protein [Clostridium]ALB45594.1 nitroreductase family protein [Clostridium beijerinckii NRRL B-598]AVK47278.1 nitroreductase [Clostridium sp. MF28]MBC2458553.1 nitroreductase family protein [Clostridium beijerinckii]MBC2476029.1 nitroreductase family protein [Clostridium beijerinckii]MCI1581558.1 nitroreductase family protein [Clostridium beijerinckii]
MKTVLEVIKERRSIRFFKEEQIKKEELEKILEAGLWAPCAGNLQAVKFVVVQDKRLNDELGKINRELFGAARRNDKSSGSIADDDSIKSAFYKAPVVIYLFAPDNYPYAIHDCCVASQNIMLEAAEINIGSVCISRGEKTFETELGKKSKEKWGLDSTYKCHSIIPLGYISKNGKPQSRKENRIIFD